MESNECANVLGSRNAWQRCPPTRVGLGVPLLPVKAGGAVAMPPVAKLGVTEEGGVEVVVERRG